MSRGRRVGLVAGVAAAAVVVVCFGLSDEIRVQYHLYRLRSSPAEHLETMMNRPDGTTEREAVRRFVATPPGRQQLLTLVMNSLSQRWNQPGLGRRGPPRSRKPRLEDLGYALLGARYRAAKKEWSVWADIRAPGGQPWGTMAIFRPPFASGEALVDAMRALCANAEPGEDIVLPEYSRLRFRILPFDEGLSSYDAILSPLGQSIENTAFWFETLRLWPELMKSEALLPWVIQVEGADR